MWLARRLSTFTNLVLTHMTLVLLPGPQHQHLFSAGQSFAELSSVRFGGPGGAGSILPYSSSSRAAGGPGGVANPTILNVNPKPVDSNKGNWTPSSSSGGNIFVSSKGPIFHNVFSDKPGASSSSSGQPSSSRPGGGNDQSQPSSSRRYHLLGSGSYLGDGGGGRLIDPPNRSSLWRLGVPGAAINVNDNHLDCGAKHMPILSYDGEEPSCGMCGDSPVGPQDHVRGGRYASFLPRATRTYTAGRLLPVRFFLNHTIIPEMDKVTFSLCPGMTWRDVSWDCVEGRSLQVVGYGDAYLPLRPGMHRVFLRLPASLSCRGCVLQWKWQSSHTPSVQQCNRRPWLRSCYRPVQYVNCADVSVIDSAYARDVARYMMLMGTNS